MTAEEIRSLAERQCGYPKSAITDKFQNLPNGLELTVFLAEVAIQLAELNANIQMLNETTRWGFRNI